MSGPDGESGTPETVTVAELVALVASLRAVLASIDAGELVCSKGYRSRLRGAVVALEALSGVSTATDTPGAVE